MQILQIGNSLGMVCLKSHTFDYSTQTRVYKQTIQLKYREKSFAETRIQKSMNGQLNTNGSWNIFFDRAWSLH